MRRHRAEIQGPGPFVTPVSAALTNDFAGSKKAFPSRSQKDWFYLPGLRAYPREKTEIFSIGDGKSKEPPVTLLPSGRKRR